MKQFFKFFFASVLGTIVTLFLVFIFIFAMISAMVSMSEKETIVENNSILVLKLDNPVVDREPNMPFDLSEIYPGMNEKAMGLDRITQNLEKAAVDPKIIGVYLNVEGLSGGIANIQEIREAIVKFKESGKFIYTYANDMGQGAYYLATATDKICVNPEGSFTFKGLGAQIMFYKGLLDKLDIEMQVIRVGKYKSAVEPFVLNKMSEANREQMEKLLNSIWDAMLADISTARNISIDELNKIADELTATSGKEAKELNMIDELIYKDEFLAMLMEEGKVDNPDDLKTVSLADYHKAPWPVERTLDFKNRIAVIYASGEIVMGKGGDQLIGSEGISKAIRKARLDDKVKAIVLRVNSPGGSALASEIILREAELAKKAKPFIVSMGDYAASGGYYISCKADHIFADKTTLTGSIGVFGLIPNAQKAMNEILGVNIDEVSTNKNADYFGIMKPLSPYQREVMQRGVNDIYQTFIHHVAEGRNMTPEYVDSIGQGRVWSGVDALGLGLVDAYGNLEDALAYAAEKIGVENYKLDVLPERKDPFEQILSDLRGNAKIEAEQLLGPYGKYAKGIKHLADGERVKARVPFDMIIE